MLSKSFTIGWIMSFVFVHQRQSVSHLDLMNYYYAALFFLLLQILYIYTIHIYKSFVFYILRVCVPYTLIIASIHVVFFLVWMVCVNTHDSCAKGFVKSLENKMVVQYLFYFKTYIFLKFFTDLNNFVESDYLLWYLPHNIINYFKF